MRMQLESDGLLRELRLERWSDLTADETYALIPFAAHTEAERTFGNYTVPSCLYATWWAGTDHEFEFFRTEVDAIEYWP